MMSRALLFAAAVAMVPGAALAQSEADSKSDSKPADKAKAKETKTKTTDASDIAPGVYVQDLLEAVPPTGTAITKLDVDNRLGDVRIVGHDGRGLSIFAVKHAPDAETLERLEVKLLQDPAGPVSIRTQLAAGKGASAIPAGSARIDLVVRVPRNAKVSAAVWNGKLRVKGLDNGADASANEGEIHLERISGMVTADSATGKQRFEKITGDLEANSIEGDVDVDTLRGERLAASVKTGNVNAKSVVVRDMVIRVIKGDIRVDAEVIAGGSYTLAAINGDVEARFSSETRVKVSAKTKRGELSLPERLKPRDSSATEVVGYLGSGKNPAHVSVETRTGNVVVAQF